MVVGRNWHMERNKVQRIYAKDEQALCTKHDIFSLK